MKENQILPNTNLSEYIGQWVVICNNKVVAHDKKLTKINKEISKCKTAPIIAKIPKKETLLF